jgi:hypothetical protein
VALHIKRTVRRSTVVGALLLLALGVAGAGPAQASLAVQLRSAFPAEVPAGFASWDEVLAMQTRLDRAAGAVRGAADGLTGSGLAGIEVATESRELVVYWKGAIPTAVRQAADAAGKDVPVRFVAAKFSLAEMLPEVQRIGGLAGVLETHPQVDGSGVHVGLRSGSAANAARAAGPIALTSTVDLQVETSDGQPVQLSRENDSAPWYGGAKTTNCTTGFAIQRAGVDYMFYAAHCGTGTAKDGHGDTIGKIVGVDYSTDTSLITANGGARGRTWDGPYNETSFTKPVQSAVFSEVGDGLCTSGAWSGIRCGIKVKAQYVKFDNVFPLVQAERADHLSAAGKGDSGGPVFQLPSPDNGYVIAKGIVSKADSTASASCVGIAGPPCSWRIYYADATVTLTKYSASIIKG